MKNDEKKIEIYALSKQIDKISVEDLENGKVKVTVDLSQVEKEQEYLESKELVSPIKEQAHFKKIQLMKEAQKLKKETKDCLENKDMLKMLEEKIKDGEKSIDYLMTTYKPFALSSAKAWLNNDRLNLRNDWNQILDMAIFNAIMNYSLEVGTQFTTFLTTIIKRDCKENKCQSSIVSVNASAMHKARMLKKAEEKVIANGGSIDDDYAVAQAMGRDVSTPRKLQSFREMRMDMKMVSPQGISMEATVEEGNRTLGESLSGDGINGEDYIIIQDYKKRMALFLKKLPKNFRLVIKTIVDPSTKSVKIPEQEKIIERLAGNEEFRNLLLEGKRLNFSDIILEILAELSEN